MGRWLGAGSAPSRLHESGQAVSDAPWQRHLEGWPLGLLAVGVALLAVVLFFPRPADLLVLPLPAVDWREAARASELDAARAAEAFADPLPFDVRALGEQIRRYGRVEQERRATLEDQRAVRRAAREALSAHGADALLRLRAVQTQLFAEAFAEYRRGAAPGVELQELGGDFVRRAERSHWLDPPYPLGSEELETLFRLRWTELAGLTSEKSFRPTLNEWRIASSLVLRHVDRSPGSLERGLAQVDALARRDGAYPEMLAKGVLYFRHQTYPLAAEAFQRHVASHPDGPFGLAAKNYLVAALEAAGAQAP